MTSRDLIKPSFRPWLAHSTKKKMAVSTAPTTMTPSTRSFLMSKLHDSQNGQPFCFCMCPAKEFKTKTGDVYLKCGEDVDYKAITDVLKMCKGSDDKKIVYESSRLGCKMNIQKSKFLELHPNLFGNAESHPLCKDHHMICKLGIATGEKNKGKLYFTCAVPYPDHPCDYFGWLADHEGFEDLKNETTSSASHIREHIQKKGNLFGKRKRLDMV